MAQTYITNILYAGLFFLFIAAIITLPYAIHQYRKYGSLPFIRVLVVYSFIFYLICIYFLAILPLPSISSVANSTSAYMNLIPFKYVGEILVKSKIDPGNVASYINIFKRKEWIEPLLNILMFFPLGVYLRYYFRCSWKKTLLICFLSTLFIELTQLSGLYFIYPRPYRLFDVNDLIENTAGGMLGYLAMPLLTFILPSREAIDDNAFKKGQNVTIWRRLIGLLVDSLLISFALLAINLLIKDGLYDLIAIVVIIGYFIYVPLLRKGSTFGNSLVKIAVAGKDGPAKITNYIIRTLILNVYMLNGRYINELLTVIYPYVGSIGGSIVKGLAIVLNFSYFAVLFIMIYQGIRNILNPQYLFFYERLSGTKMVSTLVNKNDQPADRT